MKKQEKGGKSVSVMTIREELIKREQDILKLIQIAEKNIGNKQNSTVQISTGRGRPQYYQSFLDQNGVRRKKYLSTKTNLAEIKSLAQHSYNCEFLKVAYQQLQAVRTALKNIDEESLVNVFAMLHPARRKLINPFVMDIEEYIKRWEAVEIPPSYFDPNLPEFFTERGEQVRSKSEKIIADKYYMIGIPYRYEQPLILLDRGKRVRVRPDFTVLNVRTRVQRFHEHLGRMDDPKYIYKNIYKLRLYEKNGIFVGDQLILTYESKDRPLDMSHLERLIDRYIM